MTMLDALRAEPVDTLRRMVDRDNVTADELAHGDVVLAKMRSAKARGLSWKTCQGIVRRMAVLVLAEVTA